MFKIICSKNKKATTNVDCSKCFSKTQYAISRPICVRQFITSKEELVEAGKEKK